MASSKRRVGVVGASGYSGSVLTAVLASHPGVDVAFCTSDKRRGEAVADALQPLARGLLGLTFIENAAALARSADVDLVFLATSAAVSVDLAPRILQSSTARIVDLSGAFRLETQDDYVAYYGFHHPRPDLLTAAHYGLPELFGAPPPSSRIIANPGCYATAALLSTAPLLASGLVEPGHVIIDAKSGTSGAGRQAKDDFAFCEVAGDLRAYKVLTHQHSPEIALGLARHAGRSAVTFVPHLLPLRRGLLTTSYLRPKAGVKRDELVAVLREAYKNKPFVRVVDAAHVTIKAVAGTNLAYVGVEANAEAVVTIGAIDNLVKGAAGQAVQNMNLACGFAETAGLDTLMRFAP